jgi:hypothetical protein
VDKCYGIGFLGNTWLHLPKVPTPHMACSEFIQGFQREQLICYGSQRKKILHFKLTLDYAMFYKIHSRLKEGGLRDIQI